MSLVYTVAVAPGRPPLRDATAHRDSQRLRVQANINKAAPFTICFLFPPCSLFIRQYWLGPLLVADRSDVYMKSSLPNVLGMSAQRNKTSEPRKRKWRENGKNAQPHKDLLALTPRPRRRETEAAAARGSLRRREGGK